MAGDALRIALQRPHGIGRGERIEVALTDRVHDRPEILFINILEPVRKMAGDDGKILRIRPERLIKIGPLAFVARTEAISGDQAIRFVILFQDRPGAGEINTGQILRPLFRELFVEVIAQIEDVIGGDKTFARKDINGVGDGARISQIARRAPRPSSAGCATRSGKYPAAARSRRPSLHLGSASHKRKRNRSPRSSPPTSNRMRPGRFAGGATWRILFRAARLPRPG